MLEVERRKRKEKKGKEKKCDEKIVENGENRCLSQRKKRKNVKDILITHNVALIEFNMDHAE
jgi:hypothetical protein